jgi:hypothetical protein
MSEKHVDFEGWWKARSLGVKILVVIGFAVLGLGALALFGWAVMLLWNWVVPETFGLKPLSYWKAWGLFLLCSILFKGMGSSSSGSGKRSDRKRKERLRSYMKEEGEEEGAASQGSGS